MNGRAIHTSAAKVRQMVECPNCGQIGDASVMLTRWSNRTKHYTWVCCSHRAGLDPSKGGGKSWLEER